MRKLAFIIIFLGISQSAFGYSSLIKKFLFNGGDYIANPVIAGDELFTISAKDKTLYASGLGLSAKDKASGLRSVGEKGAFANTKFLLYIKESFVVIDSGGNVKVMDSQSVLVPVGKPGGWKDTISAATVKGRLFTLTKNGSLFLTDISTGVKTAMGGKKYPKAEDIYGTENYLLMRDSDGHLYNVNWGDPYNADKMAKASWKRTIAGTGNLMEGEGVNTLYTVNSTGGFYANNTLTGKWEKLESPENYGKTKHLLAYDRYTFITIDNDGSVFMTFMDIHGNGNRPK